MTALVGSVNDGACRLMTRAAGRAREHPPTSALSSCRQTLWVLPGTLVLFRSKETQVAIPVVDLFAGPGGLNEGFSSVKDVDGNFVFQTKASFEMESNAIATLQLRAAMRLLRDADGFPKAYYRFLHGDLTWSEFTGLPEISGALAAVLHDEIHQRRLGESARPEVDQIIANRVPTDGSPFVLIGGPPCQAYSLAGRSRRAHDETFADDEKHFLFREYLHIIERFEPAVFVMENVKGLLSSTHSGMNMFQMIKRDLEVGGRYQIRSLVVEEDEPAPSDFVIKAEQYGVAQRRHRVILLGVRQDSGLRVETLTRAPRSSTVREALTGLPPVRSLISPRRLDSAELWAETRDAGRAISGASKHREGVPSVGGSPIGFEPVFSAHPLRRWLLDPRLEKVTLHEPRAHMVEDLKRYEYLALEREKGHRPNVRELPPELKPVHANVDKDVTPFLDRFKVQDWAGPSSTVTSHISKDGHYFIHPDASQMRSLTVREAARLQSFPDNYFFRGGRTAQYHQVGNAVPPYLAFQIGHVVARAMGYKVD